MENIATQQIKSTPLPRAFFYSLRLMHGCESIISNLIALGLCGSIAILLQVNWLLPSLKKYHHYFMILLAILAAIQIIRSAKNSLLLPSICCLSATPFLILHHFGIFTLPLVLPVAQSLLLLGVIGLCVSIFHIR